MAIESNSKLTGCWKKTGKFGEFFGSPNVTKAELLALVEKIPGDTVQFILDPVQQKLNERSPDINIKVVAGYVKQ